MTRFWNTKLLFANLPRSFAVATIAVFALSTVQAQITNVTGDQAAPIAGAGHDYIKLFNETVNPSNGSVSIRISVPVPPSRGFTVPFAFAYDSNQAFHRIPGFAGAYTDNSGYLQQGGWSYQVPHANATINRILYPNPGGAPYQCYYMTGFTFVDLQGEMHAPPIAPNQQPNTGNCVYVNSGQYWIPSGNYLAGADAKLQAVTSQSTGVGDVPSPITIADEDGLVYYFGGLLGGGLPTFIEDRNGNQATLHDSTGSGTFTITDTAGRVAISSSGFGTTGNTVTVSGISNPYTVSWVSTTPTNLLPNSYATVLYSLPGWACLSSTGTNPPYHEITNILLPNNLSYAFQYDPVSSLISKLTYPNGAYVRYVWLINSKSQFGITTAQGDTTGEPDCEEQYDSYALQNRYVSFDGVNEVLEQDFAYTTNWVTCPNSGAACVGQRTLEQSWNSKTTTITTTERVVTNGTLQTLGTFKTVYTYAPLFVPPGPNSGVWFGGSSTPVESEVDYYNTAGSKLRTVTKTYVDPQLPPNETVTLDNTQTSQTTHSYSSVWQQPPNFPFNPLGCSITCLAVQTDEDDYDYGQGTRGALLKRMHIDFATFADTPTFPYEPSIVDRPSDVITYDGNSNKMVETDYAYNQTAVSPVSATQHDNTNYPSSYTNRGNLTTKTVDCLPSGCTNAVTTYAYDQTGQVLKVTDPCGNATCGDVTGTIHYTTYSYADNYSSGTPPGDTNAYLTKETDALGHITTFAYGYVDGQLTSSTDENSQLTGYKYGTTPSGCTFVDHWDRLSEIDYPDNGKVTYCYNDALYNQSTSSPSVTTTTAITSTSNKVSTVAFDGMGHTVKTILSSDPDGTTYTATNLDGTGKPYQVYNPTRCNPVTTNCGESTWGYTTYIYDALGRICVVVPPGGTAVSTCPTTAPASDVFTSYSGRATSVQDEGNGNGSARIQRISQVDGLGRLTSACEVTSIAQLGSGGTPGACAQDITATGFLTTYSYDTLGNLLTVNQGTLGQRTFAYDSLSRLLCAANPEAGTATCPNPDNGTYTNFTTRYSYDANGNMASRTRPKPNQSVGSSTLATTYQYDVLNRLTQRSYSDGTTPNVMFGYDQTRVTMGTQQFNVANGIGRLGWECTLSPTSCPTMNAFSYDPMGRIAERWQLNPVNNNNIWVSYLYDLLGDETDRNLSGKDFASAYNAAGRLTAFTNTTYTDATNPPNLLTNGHYDAFGHLISGSFANGLSMSSAYDPRERVTAMAVGTTCSGGNCSTNKYRFTTAYAPNSDVTSSTDTVNGNWTYTYDNFNRVSTGVATNGKGCSWAYDRYGNRWQQNAYNGSCTAPQFSFSGNNNRLDSYSYDADGNLLNDGFHNYLYDAENRIISVDSGATTYTYDARGQRVGRTTAGALTGMTYDREGHIILYEHNNSTNALIETYAAGLHLGTYDQGPGQTDPVFYYNHADWLGTERARTDLSGTACEQISSQPFGDAQTIAGTCGDLSSMHFTGKERDTESGLDNFGARYNASVIGRFMTPDDGSDQHPSDPQSWNLYSYVRNNPLSDTDPTGRCSYAGGHYMQDQISDCSEVDDLSNPPAVTVTATPPSIWQQFLSERQNFINDWNKRIDAHRPPPQKQSDYNQFLQNINNLMMGMVPYKAPIARTLDGKVHNVPDHIPDDWTHEDLELAKGELEESIKARNGEANKLGEDGPHREQIRKEEHLLRQVNKKLSGS